MPEDRLALLISAHYELVKAAALPEAARPYSVQARLESLEKLIMEELKPTTTPKPTEDDTVPF